VALYLIDNATVSVNTVNIKFGRTIKIASLVNANFLVYTDAATPVQVISPFRDINTITDYNQISRTLTLYWDVILSSSTNYVIRVQNLLDSSGITVSEERITFTSQVNSATPSILQESTATVLNEVLIEDKSIRADIETGYQILAKNPNFYIESVSPNNGDFYIANDENNGRVTIVFSSRPASNFLTSKYFKAQRKKIQKTPSRWETMPAQVSMHSWKPDIYIDFPSTDATPSYYSDDKTYFETGYKYRVIVSSEVGL
jgi:hypothetical protein